MKLFLIFTILVLKYTDLLCQKVDFYGNKINADICNQLSFKDDEAAVTCLNNICSAGGIPNVYVMVRCDNVNNCFALYKNHHQYIVYDANFLNTLKAFGFTEKNLPNDGISWPEVTIMAHEIGHHVKGHLTNLNIQSRFSLVQLELQADNYAGFILYRLGATLKQAQSVMYDDNVPVAGSNSHPPRSDRLRAIQEGFDEAKLNDPKGTGARFSPDEVLLNLSLHVKKDFSDQKQFTNGLQTAYNYYIEGPKIYLDEIKEVRYIRNHSSFYEFQNNTYQSSQEREAKFNYRGYQWGYISTVYVSIILLDGSISKKTLMEINYDN